MASPSPTVRSIVEAVRTGIRIGNYRAGSYLPAELDLAAEFGVSRGTIRRAIDVLVESGELERRPYARPTIGGQKAEKTSGTEIHVWVSHPIADESSLLFLKGISRGLAGTPYRMVVREPSRFVDDVVKSDERQFLLDLLNNDAAAGAIIQPDPFADETELLRRLTDQGKRLVFVDTPPPEGLGIDHVGTANAAAARRCVEHLLELGHSRIVCLTDSRLTVTDDRVRGYWRAMRQAGLEDSARAIIAAELQSGDPSQKALGGAYARYLAKNSFYWDMAHRAASEILAMNPRPTALFICYDVLAYWVCAFLEGAGVRIPEQMSVVGFDWLARWDQSIIDELTTASQDFEGFGWHAADLLLDRISEDYSSTPRRVLLDAPLVIRSSTAPDLMLPAYEPAKETPGEAAVP